MTETCTDVPSEWSALCGHVSTVCTVGGYICIVPWFLTVGMNDYVIRLVGYFSLTSGILYKGLVVFTGMD